MQKEIDLMERKSRAIQLYFQNTLSRKLRVKIEVPDYVARAIAQSFIYGGDYETCLNGKVEQLKNLRFKLNLDFQNEHLKH